MIQADILRANVGGVLVRLHQSESLRCVHGPHLSLSRPLYVADVVERDRSRNNWFSRSALESTRGPSIHKCCSMRPQLIFSPRICLDCTRFLSLTKVVLLGGRTLTMVWGSLKSQHVKFIQLRSLGILKTKTQQETLKSNKN